VIPPTDEYPERIEAAVKAILDSGVKAGRDELEPIAFQAQDLPRRKAPTPGVYAEVYRRDRFACRYRGGRGGRQFEAVGISKASVDHLCHRYGDRVADRGRRFAVQG